MRVRKVAAQSDRERNGVSEMREENQQSTTQKEKGAYFCKCQDERKRLGPTNSRNSKAGMW